MRTVTVAAILVTLLAPASARPRPTAHAGRSTACPPTRPPPTPRAGRGAPEGHTPRAGHRAGSTAARRGRVPAGERPNHGGRHAPLLVPQARGPVKLATPVLRDPSLRAAPRSHSRWTRWDAWTPPRCASSRAIPTCSPRRARVWHAGGSARPSCCGMSRATAHETSPLALSSQGSHAHALRERMVRSPVAPRWCGKARSPTGDEPWSRLRQSGFVAGLGVPLGAQVPLARVVAPDMPG